MELDEELKKKYVILSRSKIWLMRKKEEIIKKYTNELLNKRNEEILKEFE